MSHTPGPWSIEEPMDFEYAIVEDGKPTYEWKFIATLPRGRREFPSKVVQANARLIAAAPEMLAALQRALSWLASYPGEACLGADGPYNQVRAAIAKATLSTELRGQS